MTEFSGVVRCGTLIADSVVASSYTQAQATCCEGDGNQWVRPCMSCNA
jgi:hypothetical protein